MSRIARSTRPARSSLRPVPRAAAARGCQRHALGLVVAPLEREVDAGVDRAGRGVEEQRRLPRRAGRGRSCRRRRRAPQQGSRGRGEGTAPRPRYRARAMRRRVTFSRNVTLSLSRTCVSHCKYCAFATHRRTCTSPRRSSACSTTPRAAASRSCSCSPATTRPTTPACASGSRGSGSRTSSPTSCGAASGRSSAGCCRTRTWARSAPTTSPACARSPPRQGLMLESLRPDLVAHQGSPTKHPALRLETHPRRRGAQDPVHERHPGRHRRDRGRPDRRARGAGRLRPPAGGHPAELRPAPPLLRRGAGRHRHRGRRALLAHRALRRPARRELPGWATPVTAEDMRRLVARGAAHPARRRHPGPAEPVRPLAASSSRRVRPTSAASAPTATTSRPSTRSRRRTRSASACSATAWR